MSQSLLDKESFNTLCTSVGLDYRLTKCLKKLGFQHPTLVQTKSLPLAITAGRDLLVRARTGSGKTLAYCLPILHKILKGEEKRSDTNDDGFVKAVILVPTKELCMQVTNTLNNLTFFCEDEITVGTLMAGSNASAAALAQQEAMLRDEPNIIISTPAGLLAHIRSEGSNLKSSMKHSVESLVVDEADLVLSFGYGNDVTEIMKYLPKICQGFLMSATLSPELNSLKKIVLHSPAILKLEEDEGEKGKNAKEGTLTQFYLTLKKNDKFLVLYVFLKLGLLKGKGLFFVNTTDRGYRVKLFLEQFHIRSAVLNAELPLKSRLNIIEQYNVGNFDYLIATDDSTAASSSNNDNDEEMESDEVKGGKKKKNKKKKDSEFSVSRGLDFRGVSFVVNLDLPLSPESYTHRIGRTARGGAKGVALSLVDIDSFEQLEMLGEIQVSQPSLPMTASAPKSNSALNTDTAALMEDGDEQPTSQPQPTPLEFDLKEIEGFRYRVEDVIRTVTKIAVRETRATELKAEILNSHRLQNHFMENPEDLQLLRHDRQVTHVSKVQDHLKHVPKYLLPRGMQVADTRKRKRRRTRNNRNRGTRRTDNDPLQSFNDDDVNLDEVAGGDTEEVTDDGFDDPLDNDGDEIGDDGTGKSTAGRNAWKQKHGKGKFSRKYKKMQEEKMQY